MRKSSKPGLDAVRAAPAGWHRYDAAVAYLKAAEDAINEARVVRDQELRRLCRAYGPKAVHEHTGVPIGTLKSANRPIYDTPDEEIEP